MSIINYCYGVRTFNSVGASADAHRVGVLGFA